MKTRRHNIIRCGALTVAITLSAAACSSNSEEDAGPLSTASDKAAEEAGQVEAGETTGDAATIVVEGKSPPSTGSMVEEVGEVLVETGDGLTGADLELYLARRYEAYWQAFDLARQAPSANPTADYPELATLAAGEQLELTYGELEDLSGLGHAIREPDSPAVPGLDANSAHRVRIESLEQGVAELVSCLVNDQVRYDVTTGEILNERVITAQTRTTMAKADGTLEVIRSAAVGLDDGVAGCWLEPEESFPL